ncbi:hypothetical protein [Micromonospora sp. NPDC003241]
MADLFDELRDTVADELRPYGQYLAMRGAAPGEQRFAAPEIALAAVSLIGWVVSAYATGFLEEKARMRANPPVAALEPEEDAVRAALDEIRQWGRPRVRVTVDEEGLVEELRRLGLTRRAAKQAAPNLAAKLAERLNEAIND